MNAVTRDSIEVRNVFLADQALAYEEGLNVYREKGAADTSTSIGMRGFAANSPRVLVLLDGQPMNDAYAGKVTWALLPISEMQSVEVLRGPGPVLYGGNAMAGVIQLFTRGLRFALGVPFGKNHTDLTEMPSPLDLTALAWSWNGGRTFTRIEFASIGRPRGYVFHLGSTGCRPIRKDDSANLVPQANRAEIVLPGFEPGSSIVLADLPALLKDSNVDVTPEQYKSGCMSSVENPDCGPLFAALGLPFGGKPGGPQRFFRIGSSPATVTSAAK